MNCGAHSLPEVYGSLTGMRAAGRRTTGDQALLFIDDIRARLSLVALDEQEYFQMLQASTAAGIAGGAIYDAILGHCALKAGAQALNPGTRKIFSGCPRPSPPS
ncbi:MAG: hypothetical protein ACRD11_10155 [Terriglobia bacterium]